MRDQLRVGSGLTWAVAWALAIGASVVYLLWPGDLTWWVAPLLAVPLMGLIVWRLEQQASADSVPHIVDGPWGPPGDGGGGGS